MSFKHPGGGGGHFHTRYMPHERHSFSALNFSSRAYNFHKLKKKKNPLRSITIFSCKADFTFFAAPETVIFKISSCSNRHRHPQPAYYSQPERKAFGQRPGVSGRPECQQTRPKSVLETPILTLELALEPRIFTLELSLEPPIMHFSLC